MRVHYISPSTLPSRTANSVHVAWQCDGLARTGTAVTLYAKRSMANPQLLAAELERTYGIDAEPLTVVSYFSRRTHATSAAIAALSAAKLGWGRRAEPIISRNLYASFFFGVLQRRPLIFETHQLEQGSRKALQRAVMTRPWITTVVISNQLIRRLHAHHGVAPRRARVLHDAAPAGIVPIEEGKRRDMRRSLVPIADGNWDAVCGYFGQLYSGRGIEIVERLAAARPRTLFLVYGGNDADIEMRRTASQRPNLHFMGHVPHPEARACMAVMDVLLMPYQQHVSIGSAGHDTANWMSPMKMFEYLASGVPIVASDLPSLREVLRNETNCLMVSADKPAEWDTAIERLVTEPALASRVGRQGHADYRDRHTWTQRAESLIEMTREL